VTTWDLVWLQRVEAERLQELLLRGARGAGGQQGQGGGHAERGEEHVVVRAPGQRPVQPAGEVRVPAAQLRGGGRGGGGGRGEEQATQQGHHHHPPGTQRSAAHHLHHHHHPCRRNTTGAHREQHGQDGEGTFCLGAPNIWVPGGWFASS